MTRIEGSIEAIVARSSSFADRLWFIIFDLLFDYDVELGKIT